MTLRESPERPAAETVRLFVTGMTKDADRLDAAAETAESWTEGEQGPVDD